ncbi:proteinase inhibitor I1, Kazal [Emericellopsis atlantica]|uniref:Proteinase inhibitor I1, Kazal n=1 Tax=Emericellopsis atlantica TaxID=2614577 RepID=A0A9P7ZJF6_9HYPO|nr:proteinase inhibitor I1, Kazal [Emericellopsis atlantica]KAG9252862.1 proteinase inhibitor I1, Kazal [Emericellopsis atlantica]
MLSLILALAAPLLAAALQPCGLKIAPCPNDTECVPVSPDCTDLWRCRGVCEYKNEYPSCGGYRVKPVDCPPDADCRDDPRLENDCGMACDKPGMCIPNDVPRCEDETCPLGLWCYTMMEVDGCSKQVCL